MSDDEILGSDEVARRIGVGRRTAQRRIKEALATGEIAVINKIGRGHEYLVRAGDVEKLIDREPDA